MNNSIRPTAGRLHLDRALAVFFALLLAQCCGNVAAADDSSTQRAPAAAQTNPPTGKRPPLPPGRKLEFFSAFALWCAIVVVGLALIGMVMLWGQRIRRNVRQRPVSSTVPDPFWYLKKSPAPVTQSDRPDSQDQGNAGSEPTGQPTP